MKSFLYNIAQTFYQQYGNELYKQTFVFPNRRAGVFFQKFLSEIANKPIFSPQIITIQELFNSMSDLKVADKVDLLVMFYEQYNKIGNKDETLDEFLFWGEMLLNDFSDIDKYMVDAQQLFLNIHNLKEMDDDMSYLSLEQVEAIRQFWSNFGTKDKNETKNSFLETWEILLDLYTSFKKELKKKGVAYEGMLFREVAEKTKSKDELNLKYNKIVFVGLNALTPAEIKLLEYLKNKDIADFYWDYDFSLVRDKRNKASYWAHENLRRFPSNHKVENNNISSEKKKTTLIGVPSGVGQAKIVNQLISDLTKEGKISKTNSGLNTAVVLPDENLLIPVLYSIPKEIDKINVTMGYSLQNSSVASLIAAIASVQINAKTENNQTSIYYKFVLPILNHPLVYEQTKEKADFLKAYIQKYNRATISLEDVSDNDFLKHIFTPIVDWSKASDYLKHILSTIYNNLKTDIEDSIDSKNDTRPVDIEQEFIVQYYKTINRLQDSLSSVKNITVETYFRLLKQLSQSISISFQGEPLSGLQVMGILETRVVDFENIIILSMNEGMFPLKKPTNSFIPYTLRNAFSLPTYEHQDSTYAYHFYRMISRAKNIFMLYDTRTEDMQTGEVSRYFYQMKYLYNNIFDIEELMVNYNVSVPKSMPVSINKTDKIMAKMHDYLAGGEAGLSASSINSYINCPLQFYLSTIEKLSETDEVQESIEADVFGTIYHSVMQNIYDRYINQIIVPDTINSIIRDEKYLTNLIEQAFAEHYFKQKDKQHTLTGHNFLIGEILKDYIKQTLKYDLRFTPFEYTASEHKFNIEHKSSKDLTVNIKGSIDRIDQSENKIRVIDYKTGKGELNFSSMDDIFDASKNNRKSHILQVFIYALAYNGGDKKMSPSIYYLRSIFNDDFDPRIIFEKEPIDNIDFLMNDFTDRLNELINEMFDQSIPFAQTQNENNCQWCTFKEVCRK